VLFITQAINVYLNVTVLYQYAQRCNRMKCVFKFYSLCLMRFYIIVDGQTIQKTGSEAVSYYSKVMYT